MIHIYLTSIQDEEGPYGIVVFDFVLGKLFSNEITTLLINSNFNNKKASKRKLLLDEDYQENENPLKRKKSSDEDILGKSIKTSQIRVNYIQNIRSLPILKENNSIPMFERSISTGSDEGRLYRSKSYIENITQVSNYTEKIDISIFQKEHDI
ncbi:hypothetical protein [Pigmentibacter ruber]|uniref:hypothetical protein n=1 Tax=Pigmentibacter ruber TaxID=2683196 RepID=UPI00131B1C69|nr:hypothetical protein [Pigmentibacter ruber]